MSPTHPEFITLSQALVVAVSSMATVIVIMWRMHVGTTKATENKLQVCEAKHTEATAVMLQMKEEIGYVRGRQDGVEGLAKQVIDKIAELKVTADDRKGNAPK
jgi:hypothetical protein